MYWSMVDRCIFCIMTALYYCEQVKRQVFPAFFRLSNYELSILLSRSRDASNIQQFLYLCFENVGHIVFGTRDAFQDILSVRVYLEQPIRVLVLCRD